MPKFIINSIFFFCFFRHHHQQLALAWTWFFHLIDKFVNNWLIDWFINFFFSWKLIAFLCFLFLPWTLSLSLPNKFELFKLFWLEKLFIKKFIHFCCCCQKNNYTIKLINLNGEKTDKKLLYTFFSFGCCWYPKIQKNFFHLKWENYFSISFPLPKIRSGFIFNEFRSWFWFRF